MTNPATEAVYPPAPNTQLDDRSAPEVLSAVKLRAEYLRVPAVGELEEHVALLPVTADGMQSP